MGNMPGPEMKDGEPTRLLLSLKAWGASSKADARKTAKAISARNKAK
jgi:N-acetylglutamate synthase/N-acetylornithine aminotransferase